MSEIHTLSIADFDKNLLGEHSNITGEELAVRIINYYYHLYSSILEKISISVTEEEIAILYNPDSLEPADQEKFSRALALLAEKSLDAGRTILLELVEKYPLSGDILYNLGMSYSEQGDLEKSIKPLEKAVEVMPFFSNAYVALGYSYAGLKKYEEAVRYNRLALMYDKKNFYAYRNLAACLSKLDRYDEAREIAGKALELEPNDPQAILGYALVCKYLGDMHNYSKNLKKIIDNGINERISNYAKSELRKLAENELKSKGLRLDVVMYLQSAMQLFKNMEKEDIGKIGLSAAMMGMNGLDINNPEKKYFFKELNKDFTGLQLLCYMYAAFQIVDPTVDVGIDLSKEYATAKGMLNE
ncbi:MAG: tetratricopeptide repeat protein [Ignavibacteria bacterium]|jgi:tetratricopeptide (TPR) repeat protein|nr:tetratricopeptide repeat protein [Ignavibacteria bacterium]MCU7522275.1 tetratricopeptide repeat protein [Ignavibacteria bacterium]